MFVMEEGATPAEVARGGGIAAGAKRLQDQSEGPTLSETISSVASWLGDITDAKAASGSKIAAVVKQGAEEEENVPPSLAAVAGDMGSELFVLGEGDVFVEQTDEDVSPPTLADVAVSREPELFVLDEGESSAQPKETSVGGGGIAAGAKRLQEQSRAGQEDGDSWTETMAIVKSWVGDLMPDQVPSSGNRIGRGTADHSPEVSSSRHKEEENAA